MNYVCVILMNESNKSILEHIFEDLCILRSPEKDYVSKNVVL